MNDEELHTVSPVLVLVCLFLHPECYFIKVLDFFHIVSGGKNALLWY